jgi:hypothetical protein
MKSMPDGRLIPTPGDAIALTDGRTVGVRVCNRKFACARTTPDERRYGCYWVVGDDDEEYVVTADVSGLRSRTFVVCSNG